MDVAAAKRVCNGCDAVIVKGDALLYFTKGSSSYKVQGNLCFFCTAALFNKLCKHKGEANG